jgi:hypothetical protein
VVVFPLLRMWRCKYETLFEIAPAAFLRQHSYGSP